MPDYGALHGWTRSHDPLGLWPGFEATGTVRVWFIRVPLNFTEPSSESYP
jgi:hypothetical protein